MNLQVGQSVRAGQFGPGNIEAIEGSRISVRTNIDGRIRTFCPQDIELPPVSTSPSAEEKARQVLLSGVPRGHYASALAYAKANPRSEDESDVHWMAFLRERSAIRVEIPFKDQQKLVDQYRGATGESFSLPHPAVYVYPEDGNKWHITLKMSFNGELPGDCPAHVYEMPDGTQEIHDTRFIWDLIIREGFRLDF